MVTGRGDVNGSEDDRCEPGPQLLVRCSVASLSSGKGLPERYLAKYHGRSLRFVEDEPISRDTRVQSGVHARGISRRMHDHHIGERSGELGAKLEPAKPTSTASSVFATEDDQR